ncbi:TetR/AcrR family transcriptional regulator [Oceaniglobus ichthyenteri]|uniref:TetR/AcrR family transcriptional regulator n=1 Tax=Oceaniglobus ichthyenteri TaxID=2136177 RepID=UPI000D39EB3D|nr:TetR/AcrR family transcriptional regulator [Oceaniglobus ichthyenteri]
MNMLDQTIKKGRKFDQVLTGARAVFLADGFEGASVDEIAKVAGVSKATLYSYFPDKRVLFSEVAKAECRRQADTAIAQIDMAGRPETVLFAAGSHLIRFFLSDFGQRVFRICVAETERFPELGRQFYESGPAVVEAALVGYFDLAMARGELKIQDQPLAAHQFSELCKAELFPKLVFGVQTSFSGAEVDRVIGGAVDMFMARYGA